MTLIVTLIVLLVLLALILLGRRAARWARHVIADSEGLEDLGRRGVDLDLPRHFDFHIHFANREVAVAAAESIAAAGFQVNVSAGDQLRDAIVCASRSLLPIRTELRAARQQLTDLSRPFHGSYERWFSDDP